MGRFRQVIVGITPPYLLSAARRVARRPAAPQAEPPMPSFASDRVGAFSQYGEDLVIDAVLGCKAAGFYIDIGANDPIVFSNTQRFHRRGWTGICVEPHPGLCERIRIDRPDDVVLNLGVGAADGEMPFYRIEPDTLSTFDRAVADRSLAENEGAQIVEILTIGITTLASLFAGNLEPGTRIDFMSLDVEGGELGALASGDWAVWRPRLVMAEVNRGGPAIVDFMSGVDYEYLWSNGTNGLFRDRRQVD